MSRSLLGAIVATALTCFGLSQIKAEQSIAHGHGALTPDGPNPYGPYEFLIGDWDVKAEDGAPTIGVIRIHWGPNRSYIWYAGTMIVDGHEEPHLEGMLMWNGMRKNLDMLFCMDLKSGRVQEQGTFALESDGAWVRDITAVYSARTSPTGSSPAPTDGTTAHFRQTYKRVSAHKLLTAAIRETDHGWVATFPGSDRLMMIRRVNSS